MGPDTQAAQLLANVQRLTDELVGEKGKVVYLEGEVERITAQLKEANQLLAEKGCSLDRAVDCLNETREAKLKVVSENNLLCKGLISAKWELTEALRAVI